MAELILDGPVSSDSPQFVHRPVADRYLEGLLVDDSRAAVHLLGPRGSGKTTIARWAAERLREAGYRVAYTDMGAIAERTGKERGNRGPAMNAWMREVIEQWNGEPCDPNSDISTIDLQIALASHSSSVAIFLDGIDRAPSVWQDNVGGFCRGMLEAQVRKSGDNTFAVSMVDTRSSVSYSNPVYASVLYGDGAYPEICEMDGITETNLEVLGVSAEDFEFCLAKAGGNLQDATFLASRLSGAADISAKYAEVVGMVKAGVDVPPRWQNMSQLFAGNHFIPEMDLKYNVNGRDLKEDFRAVISGTATGTHFATDSYVTMEMKNLLAWGFITRGNSELVVPASPFLEDAGSVMLNPPFQQPYGTSTTHLPGRP